MSGSCERAAELAARRVPFVHARWCWPRSRPAPGRGTRRSCSPTGRWRASSAATAPKRRYAPGPRRARFRRAGRAADQRHGRATPGGKVMAHNPCLSGGTLEIYLEPRHPPPRMAVVGDGPIARALRTIGEAVGFEVATRRADLAALVVGLAREGRGCPLRRFESGVDYVGLVASPEAWGRRCGSARRHGGRAHRHASRVGHRRPHRRRRVALSICADVIARRPRPSGRPAADATHRRVPRAIDPVRGMTVACSRVLTAPRPRGPSVLVLDLAACGRSPPSDGTRARPRTNSSQRRRASSRPRRRRLPRQPRPGDRSVLRRPTAPASVAGG